MAGLSQLIELLIAEPEIMSLIDDLSFDHLNKVYFLKCILFADAK